MKPQFFTDQAQLDALADRLGGAPQRPLIRVVFHGLSGEIQPDVYGTVLGDAAVDFSADLAGASEVDQRVLVIAALRQLADRLEDGAK